MEKHELIENITKLSILSNNWGDESKPFLSPTEAHEKADILLLKYINDKEIKR